MFIQGKIPLNSKINEDDIERLINEGSLDWDLTNEEISPVLEARIPLGEKNSRGKDKFISLKLRLSGSLSIFGATSKEQAEVYFEDLMEDLRNIIGGKLE